MIHEPYADAHERQHKVQTEQVPSDELPAPMRHARTPHAADVDLRLAAQEVQRDAEVDGPGQVE